MKHASYLWFKLLIGGNLINRYRFIDSRERRELCSGKHYPPMILREY